MALRAKMGVEGEAYDKLNVDRIYKEAFPNLTILRLPALYGWPDTTRIENYLEPMLAGNSEIRMSKERAGWKFSRCLHKNAAFAISQCVLAGEGHYIYNVAEEPVYTDLEWCRKIAALCGWRGEILIEAAENEADFKQDFYVSSQKIRAERGFFEKYSPDEGLADTIAFYAYQRLGKRYTKYY